VNPAGFLLSDTSSGMPFVPGNVAPSITNIRSAANSIVVSFTGTVGANPAPYYYYSVNGNSFGNTSSTSNTDIVISGLVPNTDYSVQIKSVNRTGNLLSSNVVGRAFSIGTEGPQITQVQSGTNSLIVSFIGSVNAIPAPFYYYSLNGQDYANTGLNTNSNIVIENITVSGVYTVQLKAVHPLGNTESNIYTYTYSIPNTVTTPQQKYLPQKDMVSTDRRAFMSIQSVDTAQTFEQSKQKKWIGSSKDSSDVVYRRRVKAIGSSSSLLKR
jgi:hypothetical protein